MKFFRKKRNIIITVAVVLVLLLVICGKKKPVNTVDLYEIKKGSIDESVKVDGTLEPFVDVEISSDIMGKCIKIYVEEGQKVASGTKLLKIDDTSQRANLSQAETALKAAQANYDYVSYKFKNQQTLYADSLTSFGEYNVAVLEMKNAENTLAQARASYEIAQDNLEKTIIKSPIDGIVSAIYVEEGENIITGTMNNSGTVLMTVSDDNKMIVISNVDETSIVQVKHNDRCEVTFDAYGDTLFSGRVYQIGNRPIQTSTTETGIEYEVKILLDKTEKNIMSGMSGDVSIITQSKDSVIVTPIQSVVSRDGKTGVFTVENNRAKFVEVKTGITGRNTIEITDGEIKDGDKVISGPFTSLKKLSSGDKVVIDSKKKGAPVKRNGNGQG